LALTVVFATADFLDHHGPTSRFFDGFNRLALAGVNILSGDILAVLEEIVDPVLESTQVCVVLLRDALGEILRQALWSWWTCRHRLTKH